MSNYKKIIAFGDSHVAGCELSDKIPLSDYLLGKVTLEEADSVGKEHAFPALLGKLLNVDVENHALTGGSNDRSLRILSQNAHNYKDCLILFGYTSCERKEFFYPDSKFVLGRDKDNYAQVGMQWYGKINEQAKSVGIQHPFNDIYVKNILRENSNLDIIKNCVDALCKVNGADVIHLPLFPEIIPNGMFDFQGYGNYLNWCEEKKFTKMPFLHYGHDAHAALSLLLKDLVA